MYYHFIAQRMLRKILAFLLTAALAHLHSIAQINTDQVLQIGRNAMYFEDYVLSIQYFNQVISAKPYLALPYYYRALAKYNLDDLSGAESDVSEAIERNPYITDAYELRGVIRQNLGKTATAIADYDKVLSILPENKGIRFNKALAQEELKDYEGASKSYESLIKTHPSFDAAYLGRAKLYLAAHDTVAAIDDINSALAINRHAVNAYVMRADIAINKNHDYAQALSDMDEAIKLQPRSAGFFINRAFLRYKLDDYFGAMSDYDYSLQLEPLNTVALFNRSLLRAEVRDFKKAKDDLDKILTLNSSDHRALYNRAIVNKELKDYKAALADVNKLIDAFPDLAAAYFLRFDIRRTMGDKNYRRDYEKSIALGKEHIRKEGANPTMAEVFNVVDSTVVNSPEATSAKFLSLITIEDNTSLHQEFNNKSIRGRVQDRNLNIEIEPLYVLSYYNAPTELNPTGEYIKEVDDLNATHALDYMLQVTNHATTINDPEEIERHFKSIDYYNSYLSSHTPRAVDYFGRGMNFIIVHNYDEAIADFQRAISASPDFALAHFMLAVARYEVLHRKLPDDQNTSKDKKMAYQQIASSLEKVIGLSPNMAIAYFNLGVIMIETGDYTSALSAFNKAIECKKDFGEAFYNRGYVYLHLGNRNLGVADLSRAGELGIVPSYTLLKRMRQ